MLFKSYTVFSTLLGLSLASTYWDWKVDVPTGDQGLEQIDFKFAFAKAEHITFWRAAAAFYFIDESSGGYVALQTTHDMFGKPQLRAVMTSFLKDSSPDSPNCQSYDTFVSCEISVDADYSSLFTINISPVNHSSTNSWKATVYVDGKTYGIGRIALPPNRKILRKYGYGFLEDVTGHEDCKKRVQFILISGGQFPIK